MDYKEVIENEQKYYSQNFSEVNKLALRVRLGLATGKPIKCSDLDLAGKFDFDPEISFVYVSLFQTGEKVLRYGSRRNTLEETLNRVLTQIRKSPRFKNFDVSNNKECRIGLEIVVEKREVDINKLHTQTFDENRFETGVDGIEAVNMQTGTTVFYLPTDAVIYSQMTLYQALATVAKKTPIGKMTDKISKRVAILRSSKDYKTFLVRTRAFITHKDKTVPIYRGNILYPEFSYETLLDQFLRSSDWLLDNMYEDGRFLYYYDCAEDNYKDHEHPTRSEEHLYYNDLRHCGGAISLMKAYLQTGDEKYLNGAKKAIGFTVANSKPHDYNGETAYFVYYNKKGKLGGTGLALIMMMQYRIITGDKSFDEYIKGYARHLMSRMCESGEFMGYYINPNYQNGEPLIKMTDEERKATFSFYYPGEALLGLGLFMNKFKDDEKLVAEVREKSKKALDWIVDERPKMYSEMFTALPSDAWLMQAIDEFFEDEEFRKENYKNFVYGDAQAMMDRMYGKNDNPYLDYEGGFYYDYGDHYYPDGARSEGLVSAVYLARKLGDEDFANKVLSACKLAARSQFSLFNNEIYTFSHRNPKKSEGAIRFKNTRQWVRVDSIQHVACFFIRLYWTEHDIGK